MQVMSKHSDILQQCRDQLKASKKRQRNKITFGEVFFESTIAKRVRKRTSDNRYEVSNLVPQAHLIVVSLQELQDLFQDDAAKLFDPSGDLHLRHGSFFRSVVSVAIFCGSDVLASRRRLLPLKPVSFCSQSLTDLPRVSLASLIPFVSRDRPLRGTCRGLLRMMPWTSKPLPDRACLQTWERLYCVLDPAVTTLAINRLEDILFGQLRMRRGKLCNIQLKQALKSVMKDLDLKTTNYAPGWLELCGCLEQFVPKKSWIAGFDEDGALLLIKDSVDGFVTKGMREAAASLACIGRTAEVLGPFNYPKRHYPISLMEKRKEYMFIHGCSLRRGEIWALRVCI
jgi:hypothetical protein